MKCHDARKNITEILEQQDQRLTSPSAIHFHDCPECRAYLSDVQGILQNLRPPLRITASELFKERVMKAIHDEPTGNTRWNWIRPRWVTAGCAAAGLLLLIPLLPFGGRRSVASPGVALLAQSVEALQKVHTVHLVGRIRSLPGDNFALVGPQYGFVPIEIWREYGNPSRWRVEKPGRVVVMDGQSATQYMARTNSTAGSRSGYGFIEWLRPLLDPVSILDGELAAGREHPEELSVTESNGSTDLNIRRKAKGDFSNDWARNKTIEESDHTAIYRFDQATNRLQSLQVNMSIDGRDVTVAELSDIRYNEVFPASLYTLQLPADVNTASDPATVKPPAVTLTGPRDAAAYFFESLAKERWEDVLAVYPMTRVDDIVKRIYGGLEVVSIGEPFRSGLYRGYFVPYEVKLRDGRTKKHNLALRNDNPQQRWMVDGGY